jgi:ADP-heptose:LPS heptosyltransferase
VRRVLVVRLGAFGDFVLSFGPFAAIRERHKDEEVALLTTAPFAELARRSRWFDRVLVDARPAWWNLPGIVHLARQLRGWDFVYDLQTSSRSSCYFALAGRPPWSGIAPGCSHPHANPLRDCMHTLERQREQLEMAGVTDFLEPDLSWLTDGRDFGLARPYALLVPGAAPHRPAKRWPASRYGSLAALLSARGLTPVVLGTTAEAALAAEICAACGETVDLTGRTTIADVASLARGARLAVGNDTGPMHLITAAGCPSLVLFSGDSDPALTSPRGPDGTWPALIRVPDLADLPVERVAAALP